MDGAADRAAYLKASGSTDLGVKGARTHNAKSKMKVLGDPSFQVLEPLQTADQENSRSSTSKFCG